MRPSGHPSQQWLIRRRWSVTRDRFDSTDFMRCRFSLNSQPVSTALLSKKLQSPPKTAENKVSFTPVTDRAVFADRCVIWCLHVFAWITVLNERGQFYFFEFVYDETRIWREQEEGKCRFNANLFLIFPTATPRIGNCKTLTFEFDGWLDVRSLTDCCLSRYASQRSLARYILTWISNAFSSHLHKCNICFFSPVETIFNVTSAWQTIEIFKRFKIALKATTYELCKMSGSA